MVRWRTKLATIPNVIQVPAPEVEILQFTEFGPVLAVRPFTHTDHYWQVHWTPTRRSSRSAPRQVSRRWSAP